MTQITELLSIITIALFIVPAFLAFFAVMNFVTNKVDDLIDIIRYLDIPTIVQLSKHIGIRT